jgi:general nucleoside transport system permease protein
VSVGADAPRGSRYAGLPLVTPRSLGILGILLGLLAFWITLPPLTTRTPIAPLSIGAVAALLGVWAITRDEKRVGWGAVASGLFGIVAGVFATRASAENLDNVITWSTLVSLTLVYATPLTFAAIGGMFSERSGVVNIGLEGMMLMGAFFGAWGGEVTGSWVAGLAIGAVSGGLLALVHAVFSVHFRADQIVSGTAVIFLAYGITGLFYNDIYGDAGTPATCPAEPTCLPTVPDVDAGFLSRIPPDDLGRFLDEAFGQVSLLTYVAFALVVVSYFFMFRTPLGLRIRACGEHPRAADTVGINVYAVRYASVVTSGVLAALGGVYLSVAFNGSFTEKMTAGYGFIALAALIFGNWRPFGALAAALLFGFATALAPEFENVEAWSDYSVLFAALPYVLTLIAVAGVIGRTYPPAAIGRPYVKQ